MEISDISDIYVLKEKNNHKVIGFTISYSDGTFKNIVKYCNEQNQKEVRAKLKHQRDFIIRNLRRFENLEDLAQTKIHPNKGAKK